MKRTELTTTEAIYQTETDAAICIRADEDDEDIWLLKSQATIDPTRPARGDIVTVTAAEWLLIEKGLM